MKPRALRSLLGAALCLVFGVPDAQVLAVDPAAPAPPEAPASAGASPAMLDTPAQLGSAAVPPAEPPAPPKPPKPGKRAKPSATPKPPKEILFPLPNGEKANNVKIPEIGLLGQLLSQMDAAQMTRIDNEHVQMHQLKIDLYHPDGKEDFHITMPSSVFDLKTHIITSTEPVTVKTDDFELTGERMEFNTVDRTGKLLGHVSMHIHNLKQVAAPPDATPVPPK